MVDDEQREHDERDGDDGLQTVRHEDEGACAPGGGKNKKLKFSYNEQREYETIEEDIAKLEEKLENLDMEMNKNATNSVKLRELLEEKEAAEMLLMEKMDRWEYLEELAKKIENQ